jgi:hypothetical protein
MQKFNAGYSSNDSQPGLVARPTLSCTEPYAETRIENPDLDIPNEIKSYR